MHLAVLPCAAWLGSRFWQRPDSTHHPTGRAPCCSRYRQIPPLRYEWVWALKRDFPHLDFSLNGGVLTLEETAAALRIVNGEQPEAAEAADGGEGQGSAETAAALAAAEASGEGVAAAAAAQVGIPAGSSAGVSGRQGIWGVMVGRAAYNMPWDMLADADRAVFGAPTNPATSRRQVCQRMACWLWGGAARDSGVACCGLAIALNLGWWHAQQRACPCCLPLLGDV